MDGTSCYSRIRGIRLKRTNLNEEYGFTIRGGKEFSTGIFVSSILKNSIAEKSGLKVGDQILKVNGLPIAFGTHDEILSLIRPRSNLHLKIRNVGMIPVKDEQGENLTWRLVDTFKIPNSASFQNQQILSEVIEQSQSASRLSDLQLNHAKIYINTQGQHGLGCSICRGPLERPGIFVQSAKENGIARIAGLRPGDQILECNGVQFQGISFSEAVYHLKSNQQLRLIVLKGGGSDLFPGESSGYNSSSSSLNGEVIGQSEEGTETSGDVVLDRGMNWNEVETLWKHSNPPPPPPPFPIPNQKQSLIIQVKGEDVSTKTSNDVQTLKSEELRISAQRKLLEEEQKKLKEEAEKLQKDKLEFEKEKERVIMEKAQIEKTTTVDENPPQPPKKTDLAGALSNEIAKRMERKELATKGHNTQKVSTRPGPFVIPADDVKRQQHEQLIEEFKRAHRKMFSAQNGTQQDKVTNPPPNVPPPPPPVQESVFSRAKRIQKEVEHTRKMVENQVAGIVKQRQLRIERQHQEYEETEREVFKKVPLGPALHSSPLRESEDAECYRIEENDINDEDDRPSSPTPDYSNSPSPEAGGRRIVVDKRLINVTTGNSCHNFPTNQHTNWKSRGASGGGILKKSNSSGVPSLKTISFGSF